jgi:hypothetical protein
MNGQRNGNVNLDPQALIRRAIGIVDRKTRLMRFVPPSHQNRVRHPIRSNGWQANRRGMKHFLPGYATVAV